MPLLLQCRMKYRDKLDRVIVVLRCTMFWFPLIPIPPRAKMIQNQPQSIELHVWTIFPIKYAQYLCALLCFDVIVCYHFIHVIDWYSSGLAPLVLVLLHDCTSVSEITLYEGQINRYPRPIAQRVYELTIENSICRNYAFYSFSQVDILHMSRQLNSRDMTKVAIISDNHFELWHYGCMHDPKQESASRVIVFVIHCMDCMCHVTQSIRLIW